MCCWLALRIVVQAPLLWQIVFGTTSAQISLPYYHQENVIDLLEALNITRSVKGVSRSKGLEPGAPAWKFRKRVPHLTLPRDYAIYFLTSMQGAIGFHFVAKQSKNSEGTIISFTSPTTTKKDGRPLLQLTSSTRKNQLQLDYRTVHNMEPASIVFPGGTPFGNGQWGQVAFNLESQRITLLIDCEEDIVFEKNLDKDAISLILPIDLEIHFSSTEGGDSKFTGYWQTAEISPSGFVHRPWHCDNLPDSLALPYSLAEQRYSESDEEFQFLEDVSTHSMSMSDISQDRQQQNDAGASLLTHSLKPRSQEQQLDRLEEMVVALSAMLDMVKAQNSELLLRVELLEACECRKPVCSWQGREYEEGQSWVLDACNTCVCTRGEMSCSKRSDSPLCQDPCSSNPCKNGGVCHPLPSDSRIQPSGFTCSCPATSTGHLCEDSLVQVCTLPCVQGHCSGGFTVPTRRWFFSISSGLCEEFNYNGCGGNSNNFETHEECRKRCEAGACCYRQPRLPNIPIGYDHEGYDRYGYNVSGVDRSGRQVVAFNPVRSGPALFGPNGQVFSGLSDGREFDKYGFDKQGYDRDGFHRNTGFNLTGHNKKGEHDARAEFDAAGFDADGYNRAQFDCVGVNREGFNYLGFSAAYIYHCEYLPASHCQAIHRGDLKREVVSFKPGQRCEDVQCGQGCGCTFHGRSYRFGESFEYGCEICLCSYTGVTECNCRHVSQRKEIRDMTAEEMMAYQAAIRDIYYKQGIWEEFAKIRAQYSPQANGQFTFLPWHRYFLRMVERELQKVSCDISIPYFEWTIDAGSMESSTAWQGNFFGANGNSETDCVSYHPFQQDTEWVPCLRRHFNLSITLPDAINIQLILAEQDFAQFSIQMEAISGLFHLWVGGHMASPFSPYDPIFLSHYAFIDKLWSHWQDRSPSGLPRYPSDLRYVKMKPFDIAPDDLLLSQQQLCAIYVPVTLGAPCNYTKANSHHHDQNSYNRKDFDQSVQPDTQKTYDIHGYDCQGYDRHGYDQTGWDRNGYGRDHFNRDGFDIEGFDVSGYNRYGFNRSLVTPFGMRKDETYLPYVKVEVIESLFDGGYNTYGYNKFGLDKNGFDVFGFDKSGYDKDNCNYFFRGPHHMRFYFFVQQQLHMANTEQLLNIKRICPPITSLPNWWLVQNWMVIDVQDTITVIRHFEQKWASSHPFDNGYIPNISSVKDSGLWLPVTPDLRFCFELHWYSGCPIGTQPINCPDLCQHTECLGFPNAECRVHRCGACFSEWYDRTTGRHVMCQGCIDDMGMGHVDGSSWQSGCQLCMCQGGAVSCSKLPCPDPGNCQHPAQDLSQCCSSCDGCNYNGQTFQNGDSVVIDACMSCVCLNGDISCAPVPCQTLSCKDVVQKPGSCCPECARGCANGRAHGESWKPETCTQCSCEDGNVQCKEIICQDLTCLDQYKPAEECCPICQPGCEYEGKQYVNGEVFSSITNPCMNCSCVNSLVRCGPMQCQPLLCPHPVQESDQCCPSCPGCELDGAVLAHGRTVTSPDGCQTCSCLDGQVVCEQKHCEATCRNPVPALYGTCCPLCADCSLNGQVYLNGEKVPSGDPCTDCSCQDGDVHCAAVSCQAVTCRNPTQEPGECCPRCTECEYESRTFSDGQTFIPWSKPCLSCHCEAGKVSCDQMAQNCPPVRCSHPANLVGQCCPSCNMCEYESALINNGQTFQPPFAGPCIQCTCTDGNVRCQEEVCPFLPCANPFKPPDQCCPTCKVCVMQGLEYEDGVKWELEENQCTTCTCVNGDTICRPKQCPAVTCQHPSSNNGECCLSCDQCTYNKRQYVSGQEFIDPDNPCQNCHCQAGTVHCVLTDCPPVTCNRPERKPGQCCAKCPDCVLENRVLVDGQRFPNPENSCQECACLNGQVICTERDCISALCSYPLSGTCCQNNCNGCQYAGKEYPNGANFPHPTNKCKECHCINGNVQCLSRRCPPLSCNDPFLQPGSCCLQCPAPPAECQYSGLLYKHMQHFYEPLDKCRSCVCNNGTVTCQRKPCAPLQCSHSILQDCCRTCDGCLLGGKEYANGEEFADVSDSCNVCECREGSVLCERRPCPVLECPFPTQGRCCKACDGCNYMGVEYLNGQEFPGPLDPCTRCECMNGFVSCSKRPCYSPSCSHPINLPTQCCPVCEGCYYAGVAIGNGQTFADPSDLCSQCTCRMGSVQCVRKLCAPAPCSHPIAGPCDCPQCDGCHFHGEDYAEGATFPAPKGKCKECRCWKGQVICDTKQCREVLCPHPAINHCGCPVCEGCRYKERDCKNSETFPDPNNKCNRCNCVNGAVTCGSVPCPPITCQNPVTPHGECCPQCTGICHYLGQVYESGVTFNSPTEKCSECTCLAEVVTCRQKPCPMQCTHPVPSTACCPVCNHCLFEGLEYKNRKTFFPPSDPCKRCNCLNGNVLCLEVVCPPVTCLEPITKPNQCCKECPVCIHQGKNYAEGSHWVSTTNPCYKCVCTRGKVTCLEPECEVTCRYPTHIPGQCCPVCHDCYFEDNIYRDGESFKPDPCRDCSCSGGDVHCLTTECPTPNCGQQVTPAGSCCPQCRGCMYLGKEHQEGETWFDPSVPCLTCMCIDAVTTCSEIHCVTPCKNVIHVTGECCPLCADCIYDRRVYGPGESFHPSHDPCEICTCEVMVDGEQHLRCYRRQCPSLVDCPRDLILAPDPAHCCPSCAQPLSNCTTGLVGNELSATDDPCYTCQCKDLTWICIRQSCLPLSCPVAEQFTPAGACCPVCDECVIEGEKRRVSDGETWTDSFDECVTCSCNLGHVECHIEECLSVICHDGLVKVRSPGRCCYECQDPRVSCSYHGKLYQSNQHWEVNECTTCTCVSGEVHCQTEHCPQLACSSDESPVLIPGMCCPHCIPRPATCMVFGDPHYLTFDGKMIHFQGACSYILVEDCEGGDFSIRVTNEDRGRKGVSWTKEVTVLIGDLNVQLLQDWVVMVDSRSVSLPFLQEPYVYIERRTNNILLNTNIGVKVLWNGKSHLEVSLPGTYKGQACGLCGNFNNYPQDDLRIRSGQIVSSEATFGNSWKVRSGNGSSPHCADAEDIAPCKRAGYRARKEANAKCKILKSKTFERCHRVVPPEMFFGSCVYDLCACGANIDDCLCDALEAYASQCREAGVILHWRSPTLCAVGCPSDRGYVFDECGPPCPKTCFNKDVPLGVIDAHCFKPCVPGCQCPAGLVEHESHCISPDTCPKIIYGNL
ncbi:kielin/chordin-like protein [Hemitrygon akajei]|uniref:kielin/chordin-like protein n=1 Tax=Hemitrygon akajei TaxID=2704970 RepID=UPI003BF9EF6E